MTAASGNAARRLLVTGATGGMGQACARLAAEQGYQLLLADLSAEALAALQDACADRAASVESHVLDVTSREDIDRLVQSVADGAGIDAVIHTVGISPTMADWGAPDSFVLVFNALRERSHPTHLSISEAVEIVESISPRRALLVHLSHETSHVEAERLLPAGIEVAWDGLTVSTNAG